MKKNQPLDHRIKNHIVELSDAHKDPFYLYDIQGVKENCRKIMDIPYAPKSIHFAMMANSTPRFLEIVKQSGLCIFVNSLMHLRAAQKLGFDGDEIVYAASAMDQVTMKIAEKSGAHVILDSAGQFSQWCSLFPDTAVGIRCNIGERVEPKKTLAGYFIGKNSRLGLTMEAIEILKGDPRISGLHVYVGTNITDIKYFFDCYNQIAELAGFFPNLQFLDFGGGFGLSENSLEFDMSTYAKKVTHLMERVSAKIGRRIKLMLEPGRIIGGDAGYFVCRIVDIKERAHQQLLGVNASCVQFPRPLFYPEHAYHPAAIIHQEPSLNNKPWLASSVYGCSTYSRDFLAHNIQLPESAVGDIVVFGYAGSYCATAHTSFLGFPKVEEYFL